MPIARRTDYEYAVTLFQRTMNLFGIPASFDSIWLNEKGVPFIQFNVHKLGSRMLPVEWFEKDNAEGIVESLQKQKVLCPNPQCTQFIGDESELPLLQMPGCCSFCLQMPEISTFEVN